MLDSTGTKVDILAGWGSSTEKISEEISKGLLSFFGFHLGSVLFVNYHFYKVLGLTFIGTSIEVFCIVMITMLIPMPPSMLFPL